MAGNPFRRSMVSTPGNPSLHLPPLTTDAPTTKTKRVKIETPPHTFHVTSVTNGEGNGNGSGDGNGNGRRLSASNSATRAPSPPPPQHHGDDDDSNDDDGSSNSDQDQAMMNARRSPDAADMRGGIKAPYNPFARTLATKEAEFGLQQDSSRQQQRRTMDVDAFKNLLLTGTTTTPLHPESPRGDHYALHSDSDTDEDDHDIQTDTERSNLMGQGRLDDLAPPAPPKPNPKSTTRGPQTVSFADFDQSIPPNFHAPPGGRGTPPLGAQRGILRPTIQRSTSDLNKPLPPAPEGRRISSDTTPPPPPPPPPAVPDKDAPGREDTAVSEGEVPIAKKLTSEEDLTKVAPEEDLSMMKKVTLEEGLSIPPEDVSTPKKLPPPPPASRRQAATSGRPRSLSNLSTQESLSDLPDQASPPQPRPVTPSSSGKLPHPPPPPPARKVHPVAPSSTTAVVDSPARKVHPVAPSASSTTTVSDPPVHANAEVKPLVPPPPPRRHPSTSGSMRTASPASSLRKDVPLGGGNSNTTAPPPPPPPRRGANSSQRSSIDGRPSSLRRSGGVENQNLNQRRASQRSFEERSAEEGVGMEKGDEGVGKRDVLEDMKSFQAEIDALRAQALGGRE